MYEIERRFLIDAYPSRHVRGLPRINIRQTYLERTGDWTIRARYSTSDEPGDQGRATLTMKRKVDHGRSIELEGDAQHRIYEQMAAMAGAEILKTRIKIPHGRHLIELDVFHNPELKGIMIAEIELGCIREDVVLPAWLGKEITGVKGYSNHRLFGRLERNPKTNS